MIPKLPHQLCLQLFLRPLFDKSNKSGELKSQQTDYLMLASQQGTGLECTDPHLKKHNTCGLRYNMKAVSFHQHHRMRSYTFEDTPRICIILVFSILSSLLPIFSTLLILYSEANNFLDRQIRSGADILSARLRSPATMQPCSSFFYLVDLTRYLW